MFTRLGPWVVRHPVSVIVGWVLVIAALTGVSVLSQSHHWETSTSAQTDFLPGHYQSARAKDIADKAFPQPRGVSTQLVVTRADGRPLSDADVRRAVAVADDARTQAPAKLPSNLRNPLIGLGIDPATRSPNGKVVIGQVRFDQPIVSPDVVLSTKLLRQHVRHTLGETGLRMSFTGDAAAVVDTERESALVQYGMMLVILVLLLLIFRSWVVALFTVLAVTLVAGAASGALVLAAHVTGLKLDQSVTGLLPVVLFGVGVDYIVFLLLRYRERLRLGEDRRTAMTSAVQRVGAAITSSAFAVIVSFAALLLSQLTSFRVLGPALGFAVLFMLVAGLTLVPAIFTLVGKRFAQKTAASGNSPHRLGSRLGFTVARSPLIMALLAVIALVVPALAVSSYQANYEMTAYPAGSESARALDELATGYPLGTLAPAEVLVQKKGSGSLDAAEITRFAGRLGDVAGVGAVQPTVYTQSRDVARVAVLLKDAPSSKGAMETVANRLRPAVADAAPPGTTVAVGGPTSALVDVQRALGPDMRLIFPVAGALIALILLLMLRSLVAPIYLLGGVVLGFLATLGAAVLVFQVLKGEPGLSFQLPLVVYLFVASIGTDYNILMISRLREEMDNGATARQAAVLAITHAGPSVAAAGLILAASFATLTLSTLLQQIGFAVAFGVLISAFVMSLVLIPGLTALLGSAAWWPGRRRRR